MISKVGAAPTTLQWLERHRAEAAATAIRAERALQILVSDGDGDAPTAAAWLVLWRAEERQRELGIELDRLRTRYSTSA